MTKNKKDKNSKKEKTEDVAGRSEFHEALSDFFASIDSLQNVTPWLMSHLLLLQKWHKDKIEEAVPVSVNASSEEDLFDSKEMSVAIPYINMRVRAIGGLNAAFSLVPRSLFTIAVSEYDVFISKLYRAILNLFPDIVDASNKDIKYSDLVTFGSLDDARRHIREREVDEFMRDKRIEQIKKIAGRFKIEGILTQIPSLSEFIEITERRNLLVHTDGVVTDEYLRVCKKNGCAIPAEVVLGAKVSLDHKYLNRAFAVLFEVGLFFGQIIWRKVLPKGLEEADGSLNDIGYQMLLEQKYDLAKAIFGFACNALPRHHDDAIDKMLRINYASAFRLSGDLDGAKKILDSVDWSSAAMDFKLAVAVTKEDYPLATSLVKKIGKKGEIVSRRAYHEWPLFRKFRETKGFLDSYKAVYGEKFVASPKFKKKAAGVSGGVEKYLDELKDSLEAFKPKPTDTVQIGPKGISFRIKNPPAAAKKSKAGKVASRKQLIIDAKPRKEARKEQAIKSP